MEEDKAFEGLKRAFTSAPVLQMADLSKSFILECDASDFATGAVLSQKGEDGCMHPIAFYSKTLNDAKRRGVNTQSRLFRTTRTYSIFRHPLH